MGASLANGCPCVTVNYALNFLRPARGSCRKIYCRAEPRKLGRTLSVYSVLLSGDDGETVASGDFTFFPMRDRALSWGKD